MFTRKSAMSNLLLQSMLGIIGAPSYGARYPGSTRRDAVEQTADDLRRLQAARDRRARRAPRRIRDAAPRHPR